MRVVLVEDHALVRAGLRVLLEKWGYSVVAEGGDGEDVKHLLDAFEPHVLIMDISMPRMSGLEALRQLRVDRPGLPVIMLSMHGTHDCVVRALQDGASGYVLKDAVDIELQLAIEAVLKNHRYLSPKISAQVIDAMKASSAPCGQTPLTARQSEVLYWLAKGKSNKEVAWQLNLSVKTVDEHRMQLMKRLNIRDLPGLVVYAIRQGIVDQLRH
ncbi:response regulator [Pseudomonas sp. NPDC089569]|uniref:response regulator n=1 Tax=Pseudomonas sp. NPDC089569 TaxID=3390722 RepID=UPI003CFF26F2